MESPLADGADRATADSSTDSKPAYIPEDVQRLIFDEFLSKPSIHFAHIKFRATESGYTIDLHPVTAKHVQSGYVATKVLSQTSHASRDVLRRSFLSKSNIQMVRGPVPVDAATDLVCFVLPTRWNPYLYHSIERNGSTRWTPPLDHEDIGGKLGNLRRAAVLVTKKMWLHVLAVWFTPDEEINDDVEYGEEDGRLLSQHLGALMTCIPNLERFYFILNDTPTVDDWNAYYHKFPVAFHDHGGSYVKVSEQPVHRNVMRRLWDRGERNFEFPYLHAHVGAVDEAEGPPNVTIDETLPLRVDSQIKLQDRISLLIGLLKEGKRAAKDIQDLRVVKVGVLVRRPASVTANSTIIKPRARRPFGS